MSGTGEAVGPLLDAMGRAAVAASAELATAGSAAKNQALQAAAAAIRRRRSAILEANAADCAAARAKALGPALLDRLALDAARVEAMAKGGRGDRGAARPRGQRDRRVDASEWAQDRAGAGATRR